MQEPGSSLDVEDDVERSSQPSAPASGRRSTPALLKVAASAAFVVVATAVQLLRQSGMPLWQTLWAEDGRIFYGEALDRPLGELIIQPYAGYGLVVPRILGSIGSELPPLQYAKWVAVSSTLIVSLLALFVYFASRRLLRSPLRRAILVGAMILLPALPFEVLGAICNLHWMFPIACIFAIMLPVDRPWAIAVRLPIVVLGPLSSPLCLLAAPIAAYQIVVYARDRRRGRSQPSWSAWIVPVVYLGACLGQLLIFRSASQQKVDRLGATESFDVLVRLYPTRVSTDLVFGVEMTKHLWSSFGYAVAGVATLVLAVLLGVKFARSGSTTRWWMAVLVLGGMVIFAFSMLSRPDIAMNTVISGSGEYTFLGSRYEVVPALFMVLALLLPGDLSRHLLTDPSLGTVTSRAGRGAPTSHTAPAASTPRSLWHRVVGTEPWRAVVAVTAVWLVVAIIPSYRIQNFRSLGPSWPEQIYLLRQACDADPATIPVLTTSPTAEWQVTLTCEEIAA